MNDEVEKTPSKRKVSFDLDEAFVATPSPSKKPRREFTTSFKLKVISAAKETSNRHQVQTLPHLKFKILILTCRI